MATSVDRGRSVVKDLEPEVRDRLALCESKIDAALDGAWHALREIHDDKLYKAAGYKAFELYAEQRWGYSKSRAYQLIDYSKIADHLKAEGVSAPISEGVARPLMKLRRISKSEGDFLQRAAEAVQIAQDTAPRVFDVPQVTVQHVESAMQHFGLYRNAKRKNPFELADDLRSALAKVTQCDAMKMAPVAFVEKFGPRALPAKFYETMMWLNKIAEQCGGETYAGD